MTETTKILTALIMSFVVMLVGIYSGYRLVGNEDHAAEQLEDPRNADPAFVHWLGLQRLSKVVLATLGAGFAFLFYLVLKFGIN